MLSGTRRTKRVRKYRDEETESAIVDADSIHVFVENRSRTSLEEELRRKRLSSTNSNSDREKLDPLVFEGSKCTVDSSVDVSQEETERGSEDVSTTSFKRSARKDELSKDEELCPERDTTAKAVTSSPNVGIEDDLFTNFRKFKRCNESSPVKHKNCLEEELWQTSSRWLLCREKSNELLGLSAPIKKGVRNFDNPHSRNDTAFSDDNLIFSDIFKEKNQSASSCSSQVETELESCARRHQNSRRGHRKLEKSHSEDLFTDFSLPDNESSGKDALRELPWGKRRSKEKRTKEVLHSGKGILEETTPGEKPPKEDPSRLMEDSEDLVNELENSEENFTDGQAKKSFVCLVDQLTDVRVREKFDSQFASRRRQAVCEELEKVWVWNDKCLYEYRRDLNIRKALSNMFV